MKCKTGGKAAVAVTALVLGVAGSALLGGTAIAGGHDHDGGPTADSDSNSAVECPWINADDSHGGVYTGDQICYLNNSANSTSGSGAKY